MCSSERGSGRRKRKRERERQTDTERERERDKRIDGETVGSNLAKPDTHISYGHIPGKLNGHRSYMRNMAGPTM